MANKRTIKKQINYMAGELFSECLFIKLYMNDTDQKKADELMGRILNMQDEFLRRVCHIEPGSVKPFFRKLKADIQAETNAIIEEMGKLHKA